MILYLVRHGTAVDLGVNGIDRDRDRMLSPDGLRKVKAAAKGLRAMGCAPERVLSSPLIRAFETAQILAKALIPAVDVETSDKLVPGADILATAAWLAEEGEAPTMLVGHMPDLAGLASYLVSGHAGIDIAFGKCAVMKLEFDAAVKAGGARLEWLLQPKALRSLRKAGGGQSRCQD